MKKREILRKNLEEMLEIKKKKNETVMKSVFDGLAHQHS